MLGLVIALTAINNGMCGSSLPTFRTALKWIQKEESESSIQRQMIENFFHSQNISIPKDVAPSQQLNKERERTFTDIAESNIKNQYQCRISMDRIPFGEKAIAPCGCLGSQKVAPIRRHT
jgi:hypothetical protein